MPVRLRYLAHDLEVPLGQFVIGRSADCQLSLDDPLVSRRHALLTVGPEGASIEDLGSRNGVLVNGVAIEGPHRIGDGDTITIGGQEMRLTSEPVADAGPGSTMRAPTLSNESSMQRSELREDQADASTAIGRSLFGEDAVRSPDRRIHALALIGGVADKALAMGRADEAERLLSRSLTDILGKAMAGEAVSHELADAASTYAVRLASATGGGAWVDYVFSLNQALGLLLQSSTVDELYRVFRKVQRIDLPLLRGYHATVRAKADDYGPAERFLLQRIEGLERLGALK